MGQDAATIESAAKILRGAISEISPHYIVSMVSGGKDSAASHAVAVELGIPIDLVIHGNTRTGIPETSQFVEHVYGQGPWDFAVADAGTAYEDYVLRKGFFGKGIGAHGFSYRILKATPFRKVLSASLRRRKRGVRIMLINGARKDESENRQKHLQVMRADPAAPGNVWVNLIHDWSQDDRDAYLASRQVPINPVAKALCRSGECMCGPCSHPLSASRQRRSIRTGAAGWQTSNVKPEPSTDLDGVRHSPAANPASKPICSNQCASAVRPAPPNRGCSGNARETTGAIQMDKWQPIETAPKDGMKILVARAGEDWVTIAAHAQHRHRGHPWREGHSLGNVVFHEPTHWRPLPTPPAEEAI